jgi:hypothetical protein
MLACNVNGAQRRYVVRMWLASGLYVLFVVVTALSVRFLHLHGIWAYLAAGVSAVPIVGVLVATGAYLNEEKDEFQRNVGVQCLLGGIGGTLSVTTIWGCLEGLTRVPHLSLIWIYPIFWIFVGFSRPIVRARYR